MIGVLREKGQTLFQSYLNLKKHLEDLRSKIATLERENAHEVRKKMFFVSTFEIIFQVFYTASNVWS